MVDDPVHAARAPADQLVPVRSLLHAHARELAQKPSGISGHHIVFLHQDLSPQPGTGQVESHICSVLRQDLLDALICPGADDSDIKGAALQSILLPLLFSFQISAELLFVECLPGKHLVLTDHGPDPLLIERDPGILSDPGRIQHIDELVRKFFPQHIVEPPDTVAACRQDHALVLAAHDFFQHPFCEAADIRMHPDLRLIEIRHVRLDPFHLDSHGLKDFHRSIFTYIT